MSPNSALPKNLQGKKHDDWFWFFKYIPRGWNAFKLQRWLPPMLVVGYNVKTWETGDNGDLSTYVYPFGKKLVVWKNQPFMYNHKYGATAIQKVLGTWKFSFHISYPLGIHFTIKLWKYKEPTEHELARGYDGVRIIYGRFGLRWDSYDAYYNAGLFLGLTYN